MLSPPGALAWGVPRALSWLSPARVAGTVRVRARLAVPLTRSLSLSTLREQNPRCGARRDLRYGPSVFLRRHLRP